jgi:hypothetical protein
MDIKQSGVYTFSVVNVNIYFYAVLVLSSATTITIQYAADDISELKINGITLSNGVCCVNLVTTLLQQQLLFLRETTLFRSGLTILVRKRALAQ